MSIACHESTVMMDWQSCDPWGSLYVASAGCVRVGSIQTERNSATMSVLETAAQEEELTPYQCVYASGALTFWDDPLEDIYSFTDGDPV